MIDMIAYIAVPYSFQSLASQNEAIVYLNKHIAHFSKKNPKYTAVNALYTLYKNPFAPDGPVVDKLAYPVCRTLIDSADVFVVVQLPGWEYSDILSNECAYAAHVRKPMTYEVAIEQKLSRNR